MDGSKTRKYENGLTFYWLPLKCPKFDFLPKTEIFKTFTLNMVT